MRRLPFRGSPMSAHSVAGRAGNLTAGTCCHDPLGLMQTWMKHVRAALRKGGQVDETGGRDASCPPGSQFLPDKGRRDSRSTRLEEQSRIISFRPIARTLGMLFFCVLAAAQTPANPAPSGLRQARLYAVASARALDKVDRNDFRAAMKTWSEILGRRKGFVLNSKVDIADTVAELRSRLEARSVDLLLLSVPDYLELENSRLVVPSLVLEHGAQGRSLYSYVLLARPNLDGASVASLRGKSILAFSRGGTNTGAVWVEVLLNKQKLGRAGDFFSSLTSTATSQACILPVFFGRADACAVDEINFELAREMNPQLGQLRVIARSRPMLENLVFTPMDPHPYHKELFETLLTLEQDARGRQLLMVFKTDRLAPFAPGDLDSARELWRDYERIAGRSQGSGAAELSREDE